MRDLIYAAARYVKICALKEPDTCNNESTHISVFNLYDARQGNTHWITLLYHNGQPGLNYLRFKQAFVKTLTWEWGIDKTDALSDLLKVLGAIPQQLCERTGATVTTFIRRIVPQLA